MNTQSRKKRGIGVAAAIVSGSLALVLGAVPSVTIAADGNVDLFSTGQPVLEDSTVGGGGVSVSAGVAGDPTILGGERDSFVELLSDSTGLGVAQLLVQNDWISLSIPSLSTGTATLQWDGVDGSIALNPEGLGGIDLTAGGTASEFVLETVFSDFGYEFVVTAWTDATHWTSISFVASQIDFPGASSTIPFAGFTNSLLCGQAAPSLPPGVNYVACSDDAGNPGGTNVVDFADLGALEVKIDPGGGTVALDLTLDSITAPGEDLLACRVTGGGVDTDLNWDGVLDDGEMRRGNGASNLPENIDRYQFGGQAGANTGAQPQPKGEWTHHQQTGPSGSFTFHAGTASAPEGTEIDKITCTDPGFCRQARPAPNKQIDFEGVGTFKNVGSGSKAPVWGLDDMNTAPTNPAMDANVSTGRGNKEYNGTFHWFEVNIDDLGEPRVQDTTPIENCPAKGFGVNSIDPSIAPADCGCPDFYRIKIYDGVAANPDGTPPEEAVLKAQALIYEAYGYIDGGNLQIHPPTGFDLK